MNEFDRYRKLKEINQKTIEESIRKTENNIVDEMAEDIRPENALPKVPENKRKQETQKEDIPQKDSKKNTEDPTNNEKPPMKKKAIMLTHGLNRYMRMRAKRNGETISEYLNNLLGEEQTSLMMKKLDERYYEALYEACHAVKFSETKERSTADIEEKIAEKAEELCNQSGITFTDYINYIVDKEKSGNSL